MTPWYRQPLAPFDLETTGLDTRNDRIVTGYVAHLLPPVGAGSWEVRVSTRVLINPGVPIHPKATEAHGITDEMARAKGIDPAVGVNSIAHSVARALLARIPVVGFNLPYDLTMLHFECLRHDVPTVAERIGCSPGEIAPIIDAHVLDKAADPYRKGSRKLEATCEYYGVRIDGAHDAAHDALAAARVAFRIATRYADIGEAPANVLHDQQVHWHRQQKASLQRFKRKTDPGIVIDPCFPVCVDPTHVTT